MNVWPNGPIRRGRPNRTRPARFGCASSGLIRCANFGLASTPRAIPANFTPFHRIHAAAEHNGDIPYVDPPALRFPNAAALRALRAIPELFPVSLLQG